MEEDITNSQCISIALISLMVLIPSILQEDAHSRSSILEWFQAQSVM